VSSLRPEARWLRDACGRLLPRGLCRGSFAAGHRAGGGSASSVGQMDEIDWEPVGRFDGFARRGTCATTTRGSARVAQRLTWRPSVYALWADMFTTPFGSITNHSAPNMLTCWHPALPTASPEYVYSGWPLYIT
jgi:hypothetical protein